MAYGLDFPQIAFKGLNDHYIKGCEFEPANMERSKIFRTIVETVKNADKLCETGQGDYHIMMCGIFKKEMSSATKTNFLNNNWEVKDLQRNPYRI